MPQDFAYPMIYAAVKKGIKDMKENPGRGIRGLVDLGDLFADGRYQKEFFDLASVQLEDENSPYYRLIERIVMQTDTDMLARFGMNLGYQSWTLGARKIRSIEQEQGFNVPWCISFYLEEGGALDSKGVAQTIRQGKELGIFSYILHAGVGCISAELLKLFRSFSDCAFMLLVEPQEVNTALITALKQAKNVWLAFCIDDCGQELTEHCIQTLRASGCLFGAYTKGVSIEHALLQMDKCEALGIYSVILIGEEQQDIVTAQEVLEFGHLRLQLPRPVLPIHLAADLALADRNISSEACLTSVLSDGSVLATQADMQISKVDESIFTCSLKTILQRSMPKNGHMRENQ